VSSLSPSSSHLPSIELLLEPGSLDVLSAIELGAAVRILRLAWQRVPGCSVPADDRALAAVARVTSAEWLSMQAQLFRCMRAVPAESGPHLLSCEIARLYYHGLLEAHAAAQEQRRRAGQASAAARAQRPVTPRPASVPEDIPTPVQRPFNGRSTGFERPLEIGPGGAGTRFGGDTARFVSSALERSDSNANQERSSAEEPVIAAIHAGIDATAQARLIDWRASAARTLLVAAAKRWQAEGRLGGRMSRRSGGAAGGSAQEIDHEFLVRISRSPIVTPALVEIAIGRADEEHAQSALGYVAAALGLVRGKSNHGVPLQPYLGDQPVLDRWMQLEQKQTKAEAAKAAITNAITRGVAGVVGLGVGSADQTQVDPQASRTRLAEQAAMLRRREAGQKGA
jgi:uncharacterized protein YdaU (DUF1376 family)